MLLKGTHVSGQGGISNTPLSFTSRPRDVRKSDILSISTHLSSTVSKKFLSKTYFKRQIGYLLRKYVFDRNFFETVKDRGVLDIPPWPDTCVPLRSILDKLNFGKMGNKKKEERRWKWDIVSYYLGKDRTVKERVERFSFIERSKLPLWLKALWAHHRYIIFSKN